MLSRSEAKKRVLELINKPLSENIEESCVELPDLFDEAEDRHAAGVATFQIPGFNVLSEALGGFPHRGTTILTGGTGLGKSTLVGNLWVGVSAIRKNIYTVPIEIGRTEFMDMLLSIIAAKQRKSLRKEDYAEARQKWLPTFLSNRGHVIANHESRLTHLDFLAEVYYHYKTRNVSFAIGDNWNFMMEPTESGNSNAQNDKALHDIITFTKLLPIHIVMIMHPKKDRASKATGKDNRVDSLDDIKGSSTSPQEAAAVLLFNTLDEAKHAPPMVHMDYCREITIAKARFNGRARGSKVIYHIDQHSELYKEYKLT